MVDDLSRLFLCCPNGDEKRDEMILLRMSKACGRSVVPFQQAFGAPLRRGVDESLDEP